MRKRASLLALAAGFGALCPHALLAQTIAALPEQTSRIRLSNRDVNHVVCVGGEIGEVKFSAEKGVAVERGGSDAWIKFLVLEVDDMGIKSRRYVTTPAEFYVACNDAIYPLYAEPADISAQTVTLVPGPRQQAGLNAALLGGLAEEDRAIGIVLAMLEDRVPASFTQIAPAGDVLRGAGADLQDLSIVERRHIQVEGMGLSASEYLVQAAAPATLDERAFLDGRFGADIFAITLDRLALAAGETARLIVVRRSPGL